MDRPLRSGAQFGGEFDFATAFAVGMKHRAARNGEAKHFLQAECLGAELGVVVLELASFAKFEFDRFERRDAAQFQIWDFRFQLRSATGAARFQI